LKTEKGDITLELFENEAPQTVGNFINLVEKGFYNGLSFHRVINEFMAQGGDPKGTGSGGPEYMIPCECYRENHRLHFRGSISMAHAGKDTGGSQFFITFVPTPNLDGNAVNPKFTNPCHTVFGRVVEGMDVLAKITRREPTDPHGFGNTAPPLRADKILEAKVLRKRSHPYEPTKVTPPTSAAATPPGAAPVTPSGGATPIPAAK
jgi:cyclophilin family peptidyl-prolyl cis-trans isomerase